MSPDQDPSRVDRDTLLTAYALDMATPDERADVERVTRLIQVNEYKRRQAPVGIRVTRRSFGKDWRYPITNRFRA